MKIICEKDVLQQAVTLASRCAAAKSPMPALEGLLISAGGGELRVTGYDLKKGLYTTLPADVVSPGSAVLNARLFGDIVRSLPSDQVTIDIPENQPASIKCGASDFSVPVTDAAEYPELPAVDRERAMALPRDILGRMLRQTIFAVSDNESRPIYTGALFEISEGALTIVAVDGFRLAMRREPLEGEAEDCRFIVPGSALSELEKLCGDAKGQVDIVVGARHISFGVENTVLISRRLEGDFLDYRTTVPTQFSLYAEVDRDELLQTVGRVSLMVDEHTRLPLRLRLEEDGIGLSCRTGRGAAEDQCPASFVGEERFTIGFNHKYLMDALRAVPTEVVRLGFNQPTTPCVLLSPEEGDDSFRYMILPVRLRADE